MILIFDTETTGKADFSRTPDAPTQPHICQLGALLATEQGQVVSQFEFLIQPDGWTISEGALAVHGITDEMCELAGVPIGTALNALRLLARQAHTIVAHNMSFDMLVLRAALARNPLPALSSALAPLQPQCTMLLATPICKLPATKPGSYKWPSLAEAHAHFGLGELTDAHSALADAAACSRIWFAIQAQEQQKNANSGFGDGDGDIDPDPSDLLMDGDEWVEGGPFDWHGSR